MHSEGGPAVPRRLPSLLTAHLPGNNDGWLRSSTTDFIVWVLHVWVDGAIVHVRGQSSVLPFMTWCVRSMASPLSGVSLVSIGDATRRWQLTVTV